MHFSRTDARRVAVRAEMSQWPGVGALRPWQVQRREWVAANDACRRDILARLGSSGPLTSRELPDTCVVPWASSGWTNNQNVIKLLDLMVQRGEVATTGRKAGALRINAIHEDVRFTKAVAAGVRREIADLARWLGLEV